VTSYVTSEHAGNAGPDGRRRIFSRLEVLPPGTVCTETYLVVGSYETETEARRLVRYMESRFFRFLVAQRLWSQHITRGAYALVPSLEMSRDWSDDALAARYGLTDEERAHIASRIRPMGAAATLE
jgi:site-specific DNA-methyltransferase (adenine-specific)